MNLRSKLGPPKVRTLVGVLLLGVMVLPFIVVGLLRLYEEVLISHTEEVLISEAVVIGEAYRRVLYPDTALAPLEVPDDPRAERYHPFVPKLYLGEEQILAPATRRGVPGREEDFYLTPEDRLISRALSPLLQRSVVRNLSGVRVLNKQGVVVASSQAVGYSLAHLSEVEAALEGEYRPVLRRRFSDEPPPPVTSLSRAAKVRVSIAIPIYADPLARVFKGETIGVVYTARTPMELSKALWIWRDKLYPPIILSLCITLGLIVALTLTLSRPLAKLREAAEKVAQGGAGPMPKAGVFAPQEIHVLTRSIDEMRDQLEARADYIREFAANAAHELKTPLTSLRGAAELLIEDGDSMDKAQRQRFLSNIHSDTMRMDSLVGRILELARIESTRPARERIDLSAFLSATKERYRRRDAEVLVDYRAESPFIEMAPQQLESLVSNLVDNGIRHSEGGAVSILVEAASQNRVKLTVKNEGPKLSAGHLDRVFERFYSTERARGGTGLGLAMVKAIVEAHDGEVLALANEEGGASFIVFLPL